MNNTLYHNTVDHLTFALMHITVTSDGRVVLRIISQSSSGLPSTQPSSLFSGVWSWRNLCKCLLTLKWNSPEGMNLEVSEQIRVFVHLSMTFAENAAGSAAPEREILVLCVLCWNYFFVKIPTGKVRWLWGQLRWLIQLGQQCQLVRLFVINQFRFTVAAENF